MDKIYAQHGDLLIKLINKIPEGATKVVIKGKFVIERGEGVNLHEMTTTELEVYEKDGVLYFTTGACAEVLTHNEHGTQTIEPHTVGYKDVEQTFDYETMEARRTLD
jgi:hypothetical protein